MNLTLVAVGRLRKGPERMLVENYLDRFAKAGRGLGLPPVDVVEVEGRGSVSEADAIARALPA
ncbi:MAG: 23S rRNA (pseudouridine(1915)-N(3))-methyltransferase RlmH, partial [Jannaschia sp.]